MTTKKTTRKKKRKLNEISDEDPTNDSDLKKKGDLVERQVDEEPNTSTDSNKTPHTASTVGSSGDELNPNMNNSIALNLHADEEKVKSVDCNHGTSSTQTINSI